MVLFEPSQFLTMRTVGEYRLHVAALCSFDKSMCLGEQLIIAPECGSLGCGIVDETTLKLVDDG